MVATIRTWAFDHNFTVAGGTTDLQFQSVMFRTLDVIKGNNAIDENGAATTAGAWTVVSSSDSVTAGAGDNITASTNIVSAAGGVAHSWIVFSSPTGFIPSGNIWMTFDFTDTGVANECEIYISTVEPTGGTITNRPTVAVGLEAQLTENNIFTNTTFVGNRSLHAWRSTVGDLMFIWSDDGTSIPESAFWLQSLDNPETGTNYPFFAYRDNDANVANRGSLGASNLATAGNYEGFWQDGTILAAAMRVTSIVTGFTTAWTNGRSNISNRVADAPFDIVLNSAAEAGYYGRVPDFRASSENVPSNETQIGDTDAVERQTCGEIWVPVRQGVALTL